MAPGLYNGLGQLSSYRGGYHAGNSYHKHQKNGTVPYAIDTIPRAIPPPKEPIDDSEGHFIVREGDYVTERYRISSLLGQGTFGKVVKCQDLSGSGEVAIKIIRAVQKYTDAAQIEIRVLRTLRDHDPTNKYKCIHLLNTFSYRNHVCIVSELLGQSVFDFLKDNDFNPFPPLHIWHFAKQLLRSVAFLHSLGLVHTDLKPENILLVNGKFSLVPITWRPNSRKKRVLQDCDIRLIDFGSATFNDEYHSQVVSTRHYRAPEIILQMGWSYPCDAWSIGCILIEFYTGEALFQTHDNLEHLAMMEAVLGPMPDDFRRKAETYRPTYFKSGRLDFPNSTTNRQSRKFVKAMKALDDTVVSQQGFSKHDKYFKSLLKKLLTFDPNQRIRVSDALKHPYFSLESHEIPQ
ncbi:kinase-like protein [Meira miltonrushii]|uniref:Kinase-like protein n=1 Tax=Meira miltonrushii TaxID=1280837 RepID=A0A316V3K3_9BASI|nr:kinase-like protein [Meira miltonrushii]PWN31834.1 kinase-like protein [Meira miltonrushii]